MSSFPTASFESFDRNRQSWSTTFCQPVALYQAHRLEEVLPVLKEAEHAANLGLWAAVMLSYEAATAFEPAMEVHQQGEFPLAWVAIFDGLCDSVSTVPFSNPTGTEWQPLVTFPQYAAAIASIRDAIAQGDCYQVNYTFPLQTRFQGDPWALYRALGMAQAAGYCAWLDLGPFIVMSFSPELFFEKHGRKLRTRPMKGTAPRGRWQAEDDSQKEWLKTSAKNRAENIMIVDLLRNDLGRVSECGSVRVTRLFDIEQYQTLFQMTSMIESVCQPGMGVVDLFRALFPCGSVTGAPKISAMKIIRKLEPAPRCAYTGSIGLIQPGGDCIFNVAIRTLTLNSRTGEVTCNVGGGITYDSTAYEEYAECLTKIRFLHESPLAFDLLETLLLEEAEYFLLDRHVRRMKDSAEYFGFTLDEDQTRQKLEEIRLAHWHGSWRVRLLASRDGRLKSEAVPFTADPDRVWRVGLANQSLGSHSPFLFHKTTHRWFYEQPLQERSGCDDLIFFNERGEMTESSIANVVIVQGERKLTPPQTAGLLAGTFRGELLTNGVIREEVLKRENLRTANEIYLINSVQKWMRAMLVDT